MTVPFYKPWITQEDSQLVAQVLESGWLTTGKACADFEAQFAEAIAQQPSPSHLEAVTVSSCTAGLAVALLALGVEPGDEVITTPLTFTATAEAIEAVGAIPVFADINPVTYTLSPNSVAQAITGHTAAILPVHFAGLAAELTALKAIATRHGLAVVEDAAHSLPTYWQGKLIGDRTSDATVFSFYANKPLTTGEGGMICCSPEVAERARQIRLHGLERNLDPELRWLYDVQHQGIKANMSDIQASLGLTQLPRLTLMQNMRQTIAATYDELLADVPVVQPPRSHPAHHAWHLYVIQLPEDCDRMAVSRYMHHQGITTSVHYRPLYEMTYWAERYNLRPQDFPGCNSVAPHLLSLPIYPLMPPDAQHAVVDALKTAIAATRKSPTPCK